MHDFIKNDIDKWASTGDVISQISWHTVHSGYIEAGDDADQYAADHYADTEARARFHARYDAYAERGLQDSEDCRHDTELQYVGLWHGSDCLTADKAVEAFRDEAAKYGITLPSTEDDIQTLAEHYINW